MRYSDELTKREKQVMGLVAQGMQSRQIADILDISVRTITTHLDHIFMKYQVNNRTAAAIKYIKENENKL